MKDEWIAPAVRLAFRRQTTSCLGYALSRKRYAGVLVDGIRLVKVDVSTDFSAFLSGGVDAMVGREIVRDEDNPRLGFRRSLEIWAMLKPTSQLRLNLTYRGFRMTELGDHPDTGGEAPVDHEIFDVYVGRARLTYQFTKSLLFRVVTQYVDLDDLIEVDPLISYKLNPLTVFFVGSSHDFVQFDPETPGGNPSYKHTDRTYFIKLQYLMRF